MATRSQGHKVTRPQGPVPAEQSRLPYNLWFFNDTQITEGKPRVPQPLPYYHARDDLELSGSPRLLVLCAIILVLRCLVIFQGPGSVSRQSLQLDHCPSGQSEQHEH